MTRKVLLPRDINGRLYRLTELVEEVNGILLYRRQNESCPLEALFMTGTGSEGHVQAQPDRIEVTNEFFRRNPDYQFVKFHTHSKGTIRTYGKYYAKHFSQGDLSEIKEQLRDDSEFMALLVTPETKLLCGMDNPELRVVDDFPGYRTASPTISGQLRSIARELGYYLNRFEARMR
jgi:hypothetical protein